MADIVIGLGQIGSAVKEVTKSVYAYDARDGVFDVLSYPEIDVMHICIPYSDDFKEQVKDYAAALTPKHIAIWSTVPVGTCGSIDARIVHTPVEGRHPELELSIRQMPRWIGTSDSQERMFFTNYFQNLYLKVRVVTSSAFTEFIKLRSTAKFGINLVWADYEKLVADSIEMPFELLKEFDQDYNKLYKNIGMEWAQRYIIDPPEGKIGGHCVVPNAKLLNSQFPSDLLDRIIAMEMPA